MLSVLCSTGMHGGTKGGGEGGDDDEKMSMLGVRAKIAAEMRKQLGPYARKCGL